MAEYRLTVNYDSLDSGYVKVDFDFVVVDSGLPGYTKEQLVASMVNAMADVLENAVDVSGSTLNSTQAKRYYNATESIALT